MNTTRRKFLMTLTFVMCNAVWAAPVAAQWSDRVEFGELKTYTHEGNLFSIDYPANWQKLDISEGVAGTAASVAFVDKTNSASLNVEIAEPDMKVFDEKLFFAGFHSLYKQRVRKYSSDAPREISSNKWALNFEFERSGKRVQGNAFVGWNGEYVSVVTVLIPKDQYSKNADALVSLVNSFEMNPGKTAYGTQMLKRYVHPDDAFRIEYPQGWKVEDLSDDAKDTRIAAVFWQPKGVAYVRIDVFPRNGKASVGQITEWAETNTDTIFGSYDEYEATEVEQVDRDSVRRVFSYRTKDTDGEEVLMFGVMVVRRYDGLESYLQIVMPETMVRSKQDVGLMRNIMDSLQIDVDAAKEILD